MTELRVYLPIEDLQPQFAAYLSSPTRARAYPPFKGQHSLIVEVTPALSIHRITDLALKAAPDMEPGILFTERQFGLLELHADSMEELNAAGQARNMDELRGWYIHNETGRRCSRQWRRCSAPLRPRPASPSARS